MGRRMIVKVQLPVATNEEWPLALVYDKQRKIQEQIPVTPSLLDMLRGIDGAVRPKAFFEAALLDGTLVLGKEASWQTW